MSSSLNSIAILVNAMHIGVCYRDLPLRPAYCRNPLVSRSRQIRGIYECRCDERLQTKSKEFTRLPYTGLVLELEHVKIEPRLINESFANTMGECEN